MKIVVFKSEDTTIQGASVADFQQDAGFWTGVTGGVVTIVAALFGLKDRRARKREEMQRRRDAHIATVAVRACEDSGKFATAEALDGVKSDTVEIKEHLRDLNNFLLAGRISIKKEE